MAGLVPAIHALPRVTNNLDARDRQGMTTEQGARSLPLGGLYLPVFTRVHNRLMMRWVAGSRAVMTNSFESVASSG